MSRLQYFPLPQVLPLLSVATSSRNMNYLTIWFKRLWTLVPSPSSKFLIAFQPPLSVAFSWRSFSSISFAQIPSMLSPSRPPVNDFTTFFTICLNPLVFFCCYSSHLLWKYLLHIVPFHHFRCLAKPTTCILKCGSVPDMQNRIHSISD